MSEIEELMRKAPKFKYKLKAAWFILIGRSVCFNCDFKSYPIFSKKAEYHYVSHNNVWND